jgi:undecaprenyl diphosphate synthase
MDGNGRWARQRGLPRIAGHRAGVDSLRACVRGCNSLGVGSLTVYAFSTENWGRPKEEVRFLLRLLEEVFERETHDLHANNVKIKVLGRRSGLPQSTLSRITNAEVLTANNSGLQLNIGFNYGGRAEVIDACREICIQAKNGQLDPNDITEELFSSHLATAGLPDPDLLIRTGGDYRVSNFLLWQIAYAEIHVTSDYWPDFREQHLYRAIADYQGRQRRFGKV